MENVMQPQATEGNVVVRLIKQFSKFIAVGIINTGIDFLVLNIEMALTGISSGKMIFILNVVSFTIATTNSYFMNKYWTFQAKGETDSAAKFSQFLAVSLVGIAINSFLVYMLTTNISPMFGLSPRLWANAAKLLATGLSLIWNFIGYKLWVFKK